jgi:hypothetical protein
MRANSLRRYIYAISSSILLSIGCSQASTSNTTRDAESQTPATQTSKKSNTGSPVPVSAGDPTPIFALIDGFFTCPDFTATANTIQDTNMAAILSKVLAAAKKNNKPEPMYVVSCYTTDPSKIYYSTSADPKKLLNSSVPEFIKKFKDMVATVTNPDAFVVGYSYGGWTSMKLVSELDESTNLMGLITVDPISMVNCTTSGFLSTFFGGTPAQGCTESPSDFSNETITTIETRAKNWLNFYQEDQTILHSGPIDVAQNTKREFGGAQSAHSDIVREDFVLGEITNLLTK